jgi:hypothetical protein
MKYTEYTQEIAFINWDYPAPDKWRTNLILYYDFRYNDSYDYIRKNIPDFLDSLSQSFSGRKTFFEDNFHFRKHLLKILFEGDLDHFTIKANSTLVINQKHKTHFLKKVRDDLKARYKIDTFRQQRQIADLKNMKQKHNLFLPRKPRKMDVFNGLTENQKTHNQLVNNGKDGNKDILKHHPNMRGKLFKLEEGELRRLFWRFSYPLFPDIEEYKVLNPRYVNEKIKKEFLQKQGIEKELSDRTKENKKLNIGSVCKSARGTLNYRLSNKFHSDKQSSYVSHKDKCFIPNDKKPSGELFYNDEIKDPKITWTEEEGFKGKVWDKQNQKWRPAYRLPDGRVWNGKTYEFKGYIRTFEEIYYREYLPPFVQLIDLMIDNNGNWKRPEYYYGTYGEKIKKQFPETIVYYRTKPSTEKSVVSTAVNLTKNMLTNDPKKFEDLLGEVEEKYAEYIDRNEEQKRGNLKNWIEKREKEWREKMDNYWFADPISEDYLRDYIENFNMMIKALNNKKNTNYPVIEGKHKYEIAKEYLKTYGWYYTIPNEQFRLEEDFEEPPTAKQRRLAIEQQLHEIRAKYEANEPEIERKQVVVKKELKYLKSKGSIDVIFNIYEDLILHPKRYRRPKVYVRFVKEALGKEKAQLPPTKEIRKKYKEKKQEQKQKRIKHQKMISKKVEDLLEFSKIQQDLSQKEFKTFQTSQKP